MGVTSIQTLIAGKTVRAPEGWEGNTIHAAFGTGSSQPQIETDRMEFAVDGADAIIKHVEGGNIFEPLACQQTYTQRDGTYVSMNGYFDVSDGYEELNPTWGSVERPNRVMVKFKQDESITNFLDQINGVTYGSLLNEGLISAQDYTTINTTIIKRTNFIEIALMILSVYMITKQIADLTRSIAESVGQVIAMATIPPFGTVGAIVLTAILLAIQIAYALLMIVLLVALIKSLIDLLIPPIVKNVGISFRTLLRKSCEKFGYEFDSNIEELSIYHYMPSKPYDTDTSFLKKLIPKHVAGTVGIPKVGDYGYLINEMWDLMKTMFNTRVAVTGNTVHLYNAEDPFWLKKSAFVPHKSINFPSKKYNTEDLNQTRMMTFATDTTDEWTIDNYKGTAYEIKTESTLGTLNGSIKGLEDLRVPLCLPNSKTEPSNIENIVITLAEWIDALTKLLGQNTKFAAKIAVNKVNILKVSQNNFSVAKIVPLVGLNVPKNHRDILSAKFLMEKFHYNKSFVTDGALGQKLIYEEVTIPFNLQDLKNTLESGKFTLLDGRVAEFIDIEYNFSSDTAQCSLSVQDVYTKKLKEITFEP